MGERERRARDGRRRGRGSAGYIRRTDDEGAASRSQHPTGHPGGRASTRGGKGRAVGGEVRKRTRPPRLVAVQELPLQVVPST